MFTFCITKENKTNANKGKESERERAGEWMAY